MPTVQEIRAERIRRAISAASPTVGTIRDRCRSLIGFVREAWHVLEPSTPFVEGWHLEAIARHLEAITTGRFLDMGLENRCLFNVPPGTAKSLMVSVFWPAWEWGPMGMPGLRYLTTSYKDEWAIRDARKHRDLVMSPWYQALWGGTVQLVRMGESDFSNSAGGTRFATAISGLTGGRGDRLILDDPNSTEGAESEAIRNRTNRIYRESAQNRINDPVKSAIAVIQQRTHEEDVSGTILRLKLPYQHVMLPMEFEPERRCHTAIFEDPRVKDGELLFPARFPPETIARDKTAMGSYAWAGQYQQRPSPRGGLLFKRAWFKAVPVAPALVRWVRGWDLAASEEATSAWTAGVKVGRAPDGRFFIGHVVRVQAGPRAARDTIINTASQDGRNVEISIPRDPGQAGKVQAADLTSGLAGFKAYSSPETGDKITRALPVAAQAEAGNIYLVAGSGSDPAAWIEPYLNELETFPTGKWADQVDATSRAFGRLVQVPVPGMAVPLVIPIPPRPFFGDHPGLG